MLKKIYNEERRNEKEGRVYYSTKIICDNCNREIVSEDYNYCPYCGEILNESIKARPLNDHPRITGITLLSREEAETLLTKEERVYKNSWWLRTPGYSSNYACSVGNSGTVYSNGSKVDDGSIGVRPALKIDASASNITVGDVFMFGGKAFKVLSPKLAWMHKNDIGCCSFSEDWKAEDANIYKNSNVKKLVDSWLEKVIYDKI